MIRIAFFDAKDYDIESFESVKTDEFEIKYFETHLSKDTAKLAADFDAVCVFVNDVIDRTVIDLLVKMDVKLIALRCAGYNNVDLEYAEGKIDVVRVPAYSPYAVAEHAMAMLLTSVRRIHKAYIRTRDFNFSLSGLKGFELHGKTVGIVGTGRIGKALADICKGFGMKVLGYDMYPLKNTDIEYVNMDDIFKNCDVISLHCPLTAQTYHLIDDNTIKDMKKGVVIINTSRGALIDSEALLRGIKDRKIGAACLDVYEEESDVFFKDFSGHIVADDVLARLISMPNVIVTSHQAFLTEGALKNIAETTFENVRCFFENGKSDNTVCLGR